MTLHDQIKVLYNKLSKSVDVMTRINKNIDASLLKIL